VEEAEDETTGDAKDGNEEEGKGVWILDDGSSCLIEETPFRVSEDVFGCGSASKLFCFMTMTTEEEGTEREDFFLCVWEEEDDDDDDDDDERGEAKSGVEGTLADWMAWMIKSEGRVELMRSICHLLEDDSR